MANIGELSVGLKIDTASLKKMTNDIQTETKKSGDALEKDIGQGATK